MNWVTFLLIVSLVPPQSGVEVRFYLYRQQEGTVWLEEEVGRCQTDAEGRCQMSGRGSTWGDGLLRGEVRWAGGKRALLWPGGALRLDLEGQAASEGQRYDYLSGETAAAPRITRRPAAWTLLALAGLGLLVGGGLACWKGGWR